MVKGDLEDTISAHLHQPFPQIGIICSMTMIWVNHIYRLEIRQPLIIENILEHQSQLHLREA